MAYIYTSCQSSIFIYIFLYSSVHDMAYSIFSIFIIDRLPASSSVHEYIYIFLSFIFYRVGTPSFPACLPPLPLQPHSVGPR